VLSSLSTVEAALAVWHYDHPIPKRPVLSLAGRYAVQMNTLQRSVALVQCAAIATESSAVHLSTVDS
jgi:hypothetical protein